METSLSIGMISLNPRTVRRYFKIIFSKRNSLFGDNSRLEPQEIGLAGMLRRTGSIGRAGTE